jgi:hypothetical protein
LLDVADIEFIGAPRVSRQEYVKVNQLTESSRHPYFTDKFAFGLD